MSKRRVNIITLGIMLSLFLASMEGTVVATAMPTIVGQMGGLSIYSWVFSIYMLTSTTTVPIYGKLSDLYGRKRVYIISMALFLAGSILCGSARSMDQLILFRAVQGLGAGGVLPLAFTIIGDLFTLEQRARMQGLFSAVWGISSVIGPLLGGFLVDQVSWHWVFWINILPGTLAAAIVWLAWRDTHLTGKRVVIDYPGAVLMTLAVLTLLLGLDELGTVLAWPFLVASVAMFAILAVVELRAADPILPLNLFRDRLFTVSILHGVFSGWAMFGSINFVPLFVQAVLGTSATQAGFALMPSTLCWTFSSIIGGRLLLRIGYRTVSLVGMVLLVTGAFMMSRIGTHSSEIQIMVNMGLMGLGMGLSIPAFLIAVQSSVTRATMGAATSTLQFSRSIGGTLGVSVLGVVLSSQLAARLLAAGVDPSGISVNALLDPVASATATFEGPMRAALAVSIADLFIIAFVAAVIGLVVTSFAPPGKITQLAEVDSAEPQ